MADANGYTPTERRIIDLHDCGSLNLAKQSSLDSLLSIFQVSCKNKKGQWDHPQMHLVMWDNDTAVCHVGLLLRRVKCDDNEVMLGGICGVTTRKDLRRQGLASKLLADAVERLKLRIGIGVIGLICSPLKVGFYSRFGFVQFKGVAMFSRSSHLPLMLIGGEGVKSMDLCGLPW
jgi:predicted acetyltransferase